jgi:hypothetical protein
MKTMINISKVDFSLNDLLVRLGYLRAKTKISSEIISLMDEILNLAKKIISPKFVVAFESVTLTRNFVVFEKGYRIGSRDVVAFLKDCFKVYGVCVTIGGALECKIKDFFKKKEPFNALVLDAAGSVAVEKMITLANIQIKEYEWGNNNVLTKRYSPGYGNWLLESNRDFLDWMGADRIGVKLNDFYQMNPEKSVSALIGVKK